MASDAAKQQLADVILDTARKQQEAKDTKASGSDDTKVIVVEQARELVNDFFANPVEDRPALLDGTKKKLIELLKQFPGYTEVSERSGKPVTQNLEGIAHKLLVDSKFGVENVTFKTLTPVEFDEITVGELVALYHEKNANSKVTNAIVLEILGLDANLDETQVISRKEFNSRVRGIREYLKNAPPPPADTSRKTNADEVELRVVAKECGLSVKALAKILNAFEPNKIYLGDTLVSRADCKDKLQRIAAGIDYQKLLKAEEADKTKSDNAKKNQKEKSEKTKKPEKAKVDKPNKPKKPVVKKPDPICDELDSLIAEMTEMGYSGK